MASATMGLRRRVPVNNPTASHHSPGSKRSRSENNNNPSHGNLNSLGARDDQPAAKKSRTGLTTRTNASSNTDTPHASKRNNKARGKSPQSSQVSSPCANVNVPHEADISAGFNVLTPSPWSVPTSLCPMPPTIPYMATFVGNATNLNKNSSVSYLDISNMTSGSLSAAPVSSAVSSVTSSPSSTGKINGFSSPKGEKTNCSNIPFPGVVPSPGITYAKLPSAHDSPVKFQNDSMYNAYQPWVIKTYGDLAKTKTITIKKYGRILRTLRGEEVNSAENSKFRFWVKSKGFHIGQPEGYDAKPADRIIGRHAVTSPGLDPPLYVPTQLPHNKALSGAEGTVPGRVYKKVAIVENFFDIIHAVHVDLEGRPGKHAGQKRTYRTITETYAFLPREAVTRFLLGCTECQRRPRSPSPSPNNLANQSQPVPPIVSVSTSEVPSTVPGTAVVRTPRSPTPAVALSATPAQSSPRPREASNPPESKSLFNYRHPKQHITQHVPHLNHVHRHPVATVDKINQCTANVTPNTVIPSKDKEDHRDKESSKQIKKEKAPIIPKDIKEKEKEERKEEKYNPLSISNLLKKEPTFSATPPETSTPSAGNLVSADLVLESRRTPESDRGSSRSSASSKRKRMLPEGRTPSPPPGPIARPWSPGIDLSKDTPVDYSLPITTTYLKHQQKMIAEKNKATMAAIALEEVQRKFREEEGMERSDSISLERDQYSPAGLIDTNLSLLATIQHLHCQVMMALTERLRPSGLPTSLMVPPPPTFLPIHHHPHGFIRDISIPAALGYNHS